MAVQTPIGWNTFTGGGSDPTLCGEPQGPVACPDPPCPISPLSISGNKLALSCTFADYSLELTIEGGAPPFIWVATGGFLTVTGTRTATLAIHELGALINFFQPVLQYGCNDCAGLSPCLGSGEPMKTEIVTQTFLRSLDCLGLNMNIGAITSPLLEGSVMTVQGVGAYPHPIGDDLAADTQHYVTVDYGGTEIGTPGPTYPNDITSWVSYDFKCTVDGGKSGSVTGVAAIAGKNGVNGTVWSGAPAFSETVNFPIARGACQVGGNYGNAGYVDYTTYIDVRTQAIVDEQCCVSPIGVPIVVTIVDAVGAVSFLNIPVV